MASASDVPSRFDVVLNGEGYVLYDPWTVGSSANAPEKAAYGFSPTFIERTNTQGDYGDNQQDFWMTFDQNDWSLGEQQKHQGRDDDSKRRYWSGDSVDIATAGSVKLRPALRSITAASTVMASCRYDSFTENIAYMTATNLYKLGGDGTITDMGAHGLSSTTNSYCMCTDGFDLYLSDTVNIRRKPFASSFTSFASHGANSIAFLNNTLYGIDNTLQLSSYDTSGTQTDLFKWKTAAGGDQSPYTRNLLPFGGKLLVLFSGLSGGGPELWVWDGQGVSRLAEFPPNFAAISMAVAQGIVFVGGHFYRRTSSSNYLRKPGVFYYNSGTTGLLWADEAYTTTTSSSLPALDDVVLAPFEDGLAFVDNVNGKLRFYEPSTGSVSTFASYTAFSQARLKIANSGTSLFFGAQTGTTAYLFPHNTSAATSATVVSSLVDFDSSLDKLFRGIKVDFDSASDGNGGTVDIAYRVGDVDGSYTTLQSGATSGTEYTLSSVSGRSISVKITLNKGTSTNGPALKRVAVRAAPVQQSFKRRSYVLNCTGRAETGIPEPRYIERRDGTVHNKDGLQMATDLNTAASSTSPITIIDKFGSFTGVIETNGFTLTEIRPNEFVAQVVVREV